MIARLGKWCRRATARALLIVANGAVVTGIVIGIVPGVVIGIVPGAYAQEAVPVRSFQHSDFARIVFDWSVTVAFSTEVENGELLVTFDRPVSSQLEQLAQRLPGYVSGTMLRDGGRVAAFALARPMSVSSFTNGTSIVIDLRPSQAADTARAVQPEQVAQVSDVASVERFAPALPSLQAPALSVRVGTHPTYSRIVFDWPSAPRYTLTQNGRAVSVDFERVATIDAAALQDRLPPAVRVAALERADGRTRITFAVPDNADIRHFPLEEKVVVDVLASAQERAQVAAALDSRLLPVPLQSAPPPEPTPPPEPSAEAANGDSRQEPAEPVVPTDGSIAAPDNIPGTTPDSTPDGSPDSTPDSTPDNSLADAVSNALDGAPNSGPDSGPDNGPDNAPGAVDRSLGTPTETDADMGALPASGAAINGPDAGSSQDQAADANLATNPAAPDSASPTTTGQDEGIALVTYGFQWSEDVGAAVFRRADNIWIVFDVAAQLELSSLRTAGAPIIARLDQLPINNATVLRATVPDRGIAASARREGFNWVIDFRRAEQKPIVQAEILADVTSEIGPHLLFPSESPGAALSVADPDIGDVIRIATFLESGKGIDGLRRYPEFEVLPSAQGLAIVALADAVLLDRNFDGFMISTPDGLAISAVAPEAALSSGPILSARRLFDLSGLMRGPPTEYGLREGDIMRSLAEVPDEKIDSARLDYAGFLMAHDRGPEALGVMRVVERNDPDLMARPENQAMKAASLVLAGRSNEARQVLNDPRLDGFAEAAIWRGAALALEGKFLEAGSRFAAGDSLLSQYPFPIKGRLGLLRIETAFANRDVQGAESWIRALEQDRSSLSRGQQAELDYHRARLAVARTDFDLGEEIFLEVMKAGDRKFAYRAELAYISLGMRQGFMPEEEALERLERLRYAWRGDRAELFLLRRLGGLYLEQPDYFEALDMYRTAVEYFPEDPIARDLAGEMMAVFENLFLDGQADALPPLNAIALYEEFQELTPVGPRGDKMVERIADRLAAIDLLPEAAVKLETLLKDENRIPPGEERATLSAKLALLYLLDNKPNEAIEALALGRQGTELFSLEGPIQLDRDQLLARARFQLGDYSEAIKELAGDVSLEADLLRKEVYRETDNWQESAKVLQRLAGNPPGDPAEGVEGDRARFVVGWAVSLFKNDDVDGLRDLVNLWGPTMANSSLAGVFDYITNLDSVPAGGDILSTVDQLLGSARFDAFLSAYRDRLFAPDDAPSAEVSASAS